jgi:FkbM family methyltransferase
MTFVSYAQNHEDVMLYRALREVKHGFYIDVGAQDPLIDSVTKAFYDRGWRGINIEPNEEYFRKLQNERPHDINLATAAGRGTGLVSFYEVAHTGLSTTNAGYAERHSESGYQVERHEVPCLTLDKVCADWRVTTVHFLKIDVEGSEREVLEGFSFEEVRPWLVVVEATEPNAVQEVFAEWEGLLLEHRYRFVYFDGLNRFYAADEHTDLARHFLRPPNWFDQYVSYQLWHTRAELDEVQATERNALVNSLNHLLAEVHSVRIDAQSHRADAQNLREALNERDRWVTSLQDAVSQRDHQLVSMEESFQDAISQRDDQLVSMEESFQDAISQRDDQLVSMEESLRGRDRQLVGLHQELAATRRRLRHMRSSFSWKITSPFREVRRAVLHVAAWFRRSAPPPTIATSAFASSDLGVRDDVAAGLTEPARLLYHNLRDAAAFQRRIENKSVSEERNT